MLGLKKDKIRFHKSSSLCHIAIIVQIKLDVLIISMFSTSREKKFMKIVAVLGLVSNFKLKFFKLYIKQYDSSFKGFYGLSYL